MPTAAIAPGHEWTIPSGFTQATIELTSGNLATVHYDGADHVVTEHHQVVRMQDVSITYTNQGPGDVRITYS